VPFRYRVTVPETPYAYPIYDVRITDDLTASSADLRFVSVAKVSTGGDVFALPTTGTMDASESSLRELLDREQAKARKEKSLGADGSSPSGDKPAGGAGRFQSGHVGYDISETELAELAKEIEAESTRDNTTYLLDMLTAILASEKSPAILTKLLDLWGNVLDSLTAQGKWTVLDSVLGLLHVTAEVRPDLSDNHKKQLAALLDNLGRPERIKMIETYLNKTPNATTEGLPAVLLSMTSAAVPALCSLFSNGTIHDLQTTLKSWCATRTPRYGGRSCERSGYSDPTGTG
jgi:hypothetical protein